MAIRTDLAMEALVEEGKLPDGVTKEETTEGDYTITKVVISSEEGAKLVGKPIGEYITVEGLPFHKRYLDVAEVGESIAKVLLPLLPEQGTVLVIGLGNYHITPDSLGPQVADWVIATRNMEEEFLSIAKASLKEGGAEPAELENLSVRPIISLAPGVMGQTGLESGELAAALVHQFDVAAVIAVDACASRSLERLGRTIQVSNDGIAPGSGVKNNRKVLNKKSLGVPVIGIVVPTMVDGETFAYDLLKLRPEGLGEEELRSFFHPHGQTMMVTPSEIDQLILGAAKAVSLGINLALQPYLTPKAALFLAE